jgi:hypothetical protein
MAAAVSARGDLSDLAIRLTLVLLYEGIIMHDGLKKYKAGLYFTMLTHHLNSNFHFLLL